jgi:hypothetical protein
VTVRENGCKQQVEILFKLSTIVGCTTAAAVEFLSAIRGKVTIRTSKR